MWRKRRAVWCVFEKARDRFSHGRIASVQCPICSICSIYSSCLICSMQSSCSICSIQSNRSICSMQSSCSICSIQSICSICSIQHQRVIQIRKTGWNRDSVWKTITKETVVSVQGYKAMSRRRTRDCRIWRAIKEVSQWMSIIQIAEEKAATASIRGLQIPRVGERFT
jgi:hypothetical protein